MEGARSEMRRFTTLEPSDRVSSSGRDLLDTFHAGGTSGSFIPLPTFGNRGQLINGGLRIHVRDSRHLLGGCRIILSIH